MTKGIVIGGSFGKVIIREKQGGSIELGELLIGISGTDSILFEVFDLEFGSQLSQQNIELISGLKLEEGTALDFMDANLRYYNLAQLKSLALIRNGEASSCKLLPQFFSDVREVTKEDVTFLTKPRKPLFLGNLRSGSKVLDVPVFLDGEKAFSHHILIAATTGKGKSNLCQIMLWNAVDEGYAGILVLDPHDEYYGRNGYGLKNHAKTNHVRYYTPYNPPTGCSTLKINLSIIKPFHLSGVLDFTDPQKDMIHSYYKRYGEEWIEACLLDKLCDGNFHDGTKAVVRRRLNLLLNIEHTGSEMLCHGLFDTHAGKNTIPDIVRDLEQGKVVIIDTSRCEGSQEILVGGLIASEILKKYQQYMGKGELTTRPVISIFIEEAPRVLGKDVLEQGPNVFSTIAREGRKFKVGLTAITQLPSLIPRDILANMNTKIILGVEMKQERQALIESAAQDLSEDDRNIASLEKGEALITSNFARFATPVKIPLFEDIVTLKKTESSRKFEGMSP